MQTWKNISNHDVSRWYRSSEIILVEKSYSQSIDLLSTGYILSEMKLS
jgi:serine/threonine protein kinase